jgi:hybrid cluster-associated redox disulfide protein
MNSKKKITKDTLIAEIASQPELAKVLVEEFGLLCVGCPLAQAESLEQGALSHDMTDNRINTLVKRLNEVLNLQRNTS